MPELTLERGPFTITISAEYDDCPPCDEYYDGFAAEIERAVDRYGVWGWGVVCVTAHYMELSTSVYMGGCSYKSADDFIAEGGYAEDMITEAIVDLRIKIGAFIEAASKL